MTLSLGFGLSITQRITGGAFNPATLFSSGEVGAWYDPSDLSTLWQDSLRTTPVTSDGDPVGAIDDKSGNGFHAIQATSGSRPLYKTSGGMHWLAFDGIDDAFATPTMDFTSTDKMSVFAGYNHISIIGGEKLVEHSTNNDTKIGTFRVDLQSGLTRTQLGPLGIRRLVNVAKIDATDLVSTVELDYSAAGTEMRQDGVDQTETVQVNDSVPARNFSSHPIYIGSRAGTGAGVHIKLYGLIIRGAANTVLERGNAEGYLAGKSGVTL